MDPLVLLPVGVLCAFIVGLSKGGLPAIGMLAVPIMSFWMNPLTAAAMLLPIYIVSDVYGVWLYRRDFSPRNLAILIPAGLLGVTIGFLVSPYLSVPAINGMVGAIGLFYCLRTWLSADSDGPAKKARVVPGIFWGTLSGLTSFISHAGAPPFQIYVLPQRLRKLTFAGTTTIVFAVVNLAKWPTYVALGQFPDMNWGLTTLLIFCAVFGAWCGRHLTNLLPEQLFFQVIRIALMILSLQLIWRAVVNFQT